MKKYINIITLCFLCFVMLQCKEDAIGQYPTDSIVPNPVFNVSVKNLPGSVKLTYDLPDDTDLLYIKAVYTLPNGKSYEVKNSVFSNSMMIYGFGKSEKHIIKLISVDRSRNESSPVLVEVEPIDSPIYDIYSSFEYTAAFGGFILKWENPLKEKIIVEIVKEESQNQYTNVETFYSSAISSEVSVRGLEAVQTNFGIIIRDIFENSTDTLFASLTPYFEERIPPHKFRNFPLYSKFRIHNYGDGPNDMGNLWDGVTGIYGANLYIATGNTVMPFFTFDMGVNVKLSRFKLWQRYDFLYALHNPKHFELYGTNEQGLASDSETLNWESNPLWLRLGTFNSYKPSGESSAVTSEDQAYALAGEDFDFSLDIPSVRYLRFKIIETWGGSTGVHIEELAFWGEINN